MDFIGYAESAASLLNADLADLDDLNSFLVDRVWLRRQTTEKDVAHLRRFADDLRPVFVASGDDDVQTVVSGLNELLDRHPVTPMISDHDLGNLHLHVANRAASVAELLVSEALLGLATLVCDLGPTRLGVCAASPCTNVYVDTSPNQSRRYCSERCSSRANVAAYRERKRIAAVSSPTEPIRERRAL
ncbi:hypothetical protein ASG90_03850 [Nocardioides sp. Soil797]|nr:hypothetical protein ASG90_03850 [Nocardioides sp. Soil797]